jgi:uncharacterized membrane protein YfcA
MNYVYTLLGGLAAGVVSTLAGGGTFIALSVLIFVGLPPAVANGTDRIGVLFQGVSGIAGFKSKGIFVFPYSLWLGLSALAGAILGAEIATNIGGMAFNRILAILMLIFVIFTVFDPIGRRGYIAERMSKKYRIIGIITFFFVGIYGGFIQAGVGFIIIATLRSINRFSLVKTNSAKVFIVSVYTLAALGIFLWNGLINWRYGLVLAAGEAVGAWLASRWSVQANDKTIRYFIGATVFAFAIKLWFF